MIEPASDNLSHRASLAFAQSFTRRGETAATVTVADEPNISAATPNDVSRAILAQRRAAQADGSLARALDRM